MTANYACKDKPLHGNINNLADGLNVCFAGCLDTQRRIKPPVILTFCAENPPHKCLLYRGTGTVELWYHCVITRYSVTKQCAHQFRYKELIQTNAFSWIFADGNNIPHSCYNLCQKLNDGPVSPMWSRHMISNTNHTADSWSWTAHQWPLLLTWFTFNPSMDK